VSDDDAVALLLAARHGLSYREIAERTGDTPAIVLFRLRRGLLQLRLLHAAVLPQARNSRATHSHSSTESESDSRSTRSSLPWNRDQNSAGVTLELSNPNP
jgi:hypothetical protein